jgi:hypothetical protein
MSHRAAKLILVAQMKKKEKKRRRNRTSRPMGAHGPDDRARADASFSCIGQIRGMNIACNATQFLCTSRRCFDFPKRARAMCDCCVFKTSCHARDEPRTKLASEQLF